MRWQAKWAGRLPWLGLLVIALAALSSLWAGPPPYGDDIRLHVYRIPLLKALWAAGVPFARWLPYLNFGYGSPLFNFYPPLSAYGLTGLYWLAGQNAPLAVNALLAMTLLLSAAGMFLLARHLYGAAGGLLAAALYTWSPHLVYQIYARGSVSNALALAFFPWAAWALLRLGPRPSPGRLLLAAGFIALVLLSHTAASLLFLGPLLLLVITATPFCFPRHELWLRLGPLLLALLLGLSLAAFSWLPALADIGHTRYALEAGKVDFSDHFADPWRWPAQTAAGVHNPSLPKSPGWAQMLLGGMGAGLAGIMWWRQKGSERHSSRSPSLISTAQPTAVAGLISGVTLFLATAWSAPVWQAVPPLRDLQFPWRLLDISTFCLPLAAGFLLYQPHATYGQASLANRPSLTKGGLRMAVYALLLLAFANLIPYLYPPRIHTLPRRPTLVDVTAVQQQYGIYGLTAWGEYSTLAFETWPPGPPFPGAEGNVPLAQKMIEPPPGLTAVAGTPWRATWYSRLSQPATVTLAVHHFPGWRAWLDDQPLAVGVDDSGRLQLTIPPGAHQLTLAFTRTPVRWLADAVTAAALMVVMGLFVYGRRQGVKSLAEQQNRLKPVEDGELNKPSVSSQPRLHLPLPLILCLLFLAKVLVFDGVDTPLVAHPADGRVPGVSAPDAGNFGNEIRLAGTKLTHPATLTLYWQALAAPARRYAVAVTLADVTGASRHTMINDAPGYTATTNWEPGQLTRDVYQLPLDALPAPAGYALSVSLVDTVTDEVVPLVDAPGRTAVFTGHLKNPPVPNDFPETIGALFGPAIKLRHAAVPTQVAVGEPLDFTLVWESVASVDTNYTVFVHLLSPDGTFAAGQDGQPVNALYPTSWWAPGEVIVDTRRWLPDLPPGTYQLEVGLYRLDTGERLSLSTSDGAGENRVLVGELQIGE